MGTIVVGVDGSENSRKALAWAAKEAQRRSSRLLVVHAWQVPSGAGPFSNDMAILATDEMAQASQHLADTMADEARDAAGGNVEVVAQACAGSPARELIELSRDAELLVVGSRGLGGFRGLLLGSVSHQCIHHAHCPVVVIPPVGAGREAA